MPRLSNVLILLILVYKVSISQPINKPYDYPIKRHTSAWDSLKTYQDLRNACQIPSEIVNQMTTEALFESLLNYPLIGDAFVFNTFQEGVEKLKNNFLAFKVLVNRDDLGKVLINNYNLLLAKKFDNESNIKKGEHSVKLSLIELVCGQGTTRKNILSNEIIILINILISTYNLKEVHPELYGSMSLSTCAWAINRLLVLNKANEKYIIKDSFVEAGNVFPKEVSDKILNEAQLYIKNTIIK